MSSKFFLWAATVLLLLLSAKQSSGNFFSSLQFTRDALMGFSRGSERTVDIILPPRNVTKTVNRTFVMPFTVHRSLELVEVKRKGGKKSEDKNATSAIYSNISSKNVARFLSPSLGKNLPKQLLVKTEIENGRLENLILVPFNETVVIKPTKRKVYRPRTSPSNNFMKAVNDIERAQANANATGIRYSDATLTKLKTLVERAIRSKSYKYARQILGQIMYLLSTKLPPGRRKRTSQKEGSQFLQGLRQRLGSEKFDSFLAVQGEVSLMFVIDDTGSMSEEIQATKKLAIEITNYNRNASIETYILSAFNDPYEVGSLIIKDESEAGEFVEEINKLEAHGGGDCPEYTFEGILEALRSGPTEGSPMYVFTDAGPKDATVANIEEAKDLAGVEWYDVTINFFTTDVCRSRRYSRGDPRNLHPAFRDLAEFTSGQAIMFKDHRELEQLSSLIGGVIEGDNIISTGSNASKRKRRTSSGTAGGRYSIPVDDSIEEMTVTISTAREDTRGQGITLQDPDNVIITSGKLSLSQISVYKISNPKRGAWTLAVSGSNGDHEFFAKSTSATNVDFEHYFLIAVPGRRRQPVEVPDSNPVIGKLNKMVITLAGSAKVDTRTLQLQLITPEGNHISDVTLQPAGDRDHFTASITPRVPVRSFKLKLKGTTRGGYPFERISRQTVKPTTAVLRGKYASNEYTLPLGRVTYTHFQLCNFGNTETFDVTVVKDKLSYVITPRLNPKRVIKGRCVIFSVRARATRSQDVETTDFVFVVAKGRLSGVVVRQTMTLFVVS